MYVSDTHATVIDNCNDNVTLNNPSISPIEVLPITWGEFPPHVLSLVAPDIIIGADIFYDANDFDDLLATVRFLLDLKRDSGGTSSLITAYRDRGTGHSLDSLLQKYDLVCQTLPSLTPDDTCCDIIPLDDYKYDSIDLLMITLK